MAGIAVLLLAIIIFIAAYHTYGRWIAKKFDINYSKKTPAHEHRDGVDYVPAKRYILLGHHFASIAGVGPIVGPILGVAFGWLPALLWIIIGSIFIGAVHDFTALMVSVRHKAKTIGAVMEEYLGKAGKKVFLVFTWFALVLIIAVFNIVVSNTLKAHPEAATASALFVVIAVTFGYFIYVKNAPIIPLTIVFVGLLLAAIWAGGRFPLALPYNAWIIILLIYVFIASVTPVWILLQPRDYLNSFLLYMILFGGALGVLFYKPGFEMPAFNGFYDKNLGHLFPILFVTVACGAVSGFHSIVSSGTTSKQIDHKKDIQFIGYGGMLLEGVLAVIALIVAAMLTKQGYSEALKAGGPVSLFSNGMGALMAKFGIPQALGVSFAALVISAFALTTLDTAARLGRYTFQELFEGTKAERTAGNSFAATAVTIAAAAFLSFNKGGTMAIWPLFGSANQMLASLALLTVTAYLAKKAKPALFTAVPTVFMLAVTLSAMALLIRSNLAAKNFALAGTGMILFLTAVFVSALPFIKKGKA